MGEQSSRTLRADKMEDVIFNGTEKRNQLNIAEVTLTISNEKGLLNLDLSEIAIKRRLYRSGESEYFINNQPAKLREIRELFGTQVSERLHIPLWSRAKSTRFFRVSLKKGAIF